MRHFALLASILIASCSNVKNITDHSSRDFLKYSRQLFIIDTIVVHEPRIFIKNNCQYLMLDDSLASQRIIYSEHFWRDLYIDDHDYFKMGPYFIPDNIILKPIRNSTSNSLFRFNIKPDVFIIGLINVAYFNDINSCVDCKSFPVINCTDPINTYVKIAYPFYHISTFQNNKLPL